MTATSSATPSLRSAAFRNLASGPIAPDTIIWLVCHYPDTAEADERVAAAVRLYRELRVPIWLFGSSTARYPASVERVLKEKVVSEGVPPQAVLCSGERQERIISLDTVQEALNMAEAAKRDGVSRVICVSNHLQLWQIRGMLRHEPFELIWVPTPLRDRRWWYVFGRVLLIPLAYINVGPRFPLLQLTRWARAHVAAWPF